MTTKIKVILGLIILILAGLYFWSTSPSLQTPPHPPKNTDEPVMIDDVSEEPLPQSSIKKTSRNNIAKKSSNENQKGHTFDEKTFYETLDTFISLTDREKSKEEFVYFLTDRKLEPLISLDQYPGLEDITIIRPQKSYKGLRYIHAQYRSSENQKEYLQHLSFEIPPSKKAYQKAVKFVQENFTNIHLANNTDTKFMTVFEKGDYNIWIRNNHWEDIEEDPFNPRTKEDIGSVTVAVEYNVHPADD